MKSLNAVYLCAAGAVALFLTTAPAAHAQQPSAIGQGSWIIDGSGGLTSSHDESSNRTTTSVNLSPTALLFLRPRFAFGGKATIGYASTTNATFSNFGIGPSARYYFGDMAGQLFPFISGSFFPVWQTNTLKNASGNSSDVTERSIALDGSLGLTRLIATHVGLTGEAYYTHLTDKSDVGSTSTSRSSYNVGLRVGITAFLY